MSYCREITRDEIRVVIDQFGAAAQVAIDAGFDAVELHFGHLYLPSSFLSPLINRRKDEYGGDIDNRSRFVREIAQRVREVVGDRIAVIAKLDMDDGLPGSIWIDEALRSTQLLDADATLDALELTQGSSVFKPMYLFRGDVPVKEFATVMPPAMRLPLRVVGKWAMGSYPYEDLYMLPAARQFVPAVRNTKLVLLGGITNRDHLETGLAEGFDFLAMGRALLREPGLVNAMRSDPACAAGARTTTSAWSRCSDAPIACWTPSSATARSPRWRWRNQLCHCTTDLGAGALGQIEHGHRDEPVHAALIR